MHGSRISLGQRQRIGLARALFGDPPLIVLDEPNSNLDSEGNQALIEVLASLKREGRTVLIVTHQPMPLQLTDKILVLKEGSVAMYKESTRIRGVSGGAMANSCSRPALRTKFEQWYPGLASNCSAPQLETAIAA